MKARLLVLWIHCLLLSVGARAQFGSDLGDEAISTLAWDHIETHCNESNSAGSIGLTTDNRMYLWGGNASFTIHSKAVITAAGNNSGPQYQMAPYYMPSPAGETIIKVGIMGNNIAAAGYFIPTYFALAQSGKLYAWGANSGLLTTQWPTMTAYVSNDSTKTIRKPTLLTVLPENTFVDFDASTRGAYWVAVSSTGKAYHIGLSGAGTTSTVFTALPNPTGVDAATFKYTRVWVGDYANSIPTIYLKGNDGKIYYTGKYDNAYGCGVPTIASYANTTINYPARSWVTGTSNQAKGMVLLFAPVEVPFPAGEDIIKMKFGDVNSAFKRGNAYAISASGKGYMAGAWRVFPASGSGSITTFYTMAPIKSSPAAADILKSNMSSDSLYILTRFTEVALPTGATKVLDLDFVHYNDNTGTMAVFDNRTYWSGRNIGYNPQVLWEGNFLSLANKLDNTVSTDVCNNVGYVVSNSFYTWSYEAINYKGATKIHKVVASTGNDGMFIISKTGRGYFVGKQGPHAGLGKMTASSNGESGDYVYYPTPIANEQLLSCQTSPGTGGPLTGPVTPTNTAVGTIDCSKTQIAPAPVAGVPSQTTLIVSVNVTTAGTFTPITVSGSGMSLGNGITSVSTTTTGVQTFYIPLQYDGTALTNAFQFTVGSAGSCTADLTQKPNQQVTNVWSLTNCSAIVPGTLSK